MKEDNFLSPYKLFGVECGDGWKDILAPIFEYIENYNKNKSEDDKIIIEQVKEKFGTLRFYCSFYTDELENLINDAEKKSDITCELCGSTDNVGKTGGWITTMCYNCAKKNAKNSKNGIIWFNNGVKHIFDKDGNEKQ